ncbi:unnamed protein product [Coregonus sp. 'balchen']|nr:unnamed protein product [Coregonus sp. 'balchen']
MSIQVAVSLCLLGPHAGGPEATEVACRIALSQPLESQGPFEVIVHKLSDVIVEAEYDSQSQQLLDNFQGYVSAHPHTVLLDPIPAMSQLLDRFASYRIMNQHQNSLRDTITTSDLSVIQEDVESKGLSFPLSQYGKHGPHERKTIFFNSHKVSKPESCSHLTAVRYEGVPQFFSSLLSHIESVLDHRGLEVPQATCPLAPSAPQAEL